MPGRIPRTAASSAGVASFGPASPVSLDQHGWECVLYREALDAVVVVDQDVVRFAVFQDAHVPVVLFLAQIRDQLVGPVFPAVRARGSMSSGSVPV